MHDGLKIMVGAGATALMAWVFHGPLGQGDAFLAKRAAAAAAAPEEGKAGQEAAQAVAAAEQAPPVNAVALTAIPEAKPTPLPAVVIPASAVPAGQCQKAVDGAVGGRVMSFQPGSAWLNTTSLRIIKDVARTLKQCSDYRVEIAGHTDNSGDEGINRLMSEERARRVRDALVEKGLSAKALSARGYGSSRPVAGNVADPANRRITFTVTAGGA